MINCPGCMHRKEKDLTEEDRRTEKRKIGDKGEDLACRYLTGRGYVICDRNFSCKMGEIDIVAADISKGIICFVEVKTRKNTDFGQPCQAVDRKKQHKLKRTAEYYLMTRKEYSSLQPRMDIAEILHTDEGWYIRVTENAF